MNKPFIKWVGGKSSLVDEISTYFPKDIDTYETYIEPFIGGGSMLFYILHNYNFKNIIINDYNSRLINLYKVIKSIPLELISELEKLVIVYYSLDSDKQKDFFLEKRQIFNQKDTSSLESATLFIFLNKTCFNGLYRENKKGEFNASFGAYNNPKIFEKDNILSISNALKNVKIYNMSFDEVVIPEGKCLIYLDPPYKEISKTSNFKNYVKTDSKEEIDDKVFTFMELHKSDSNKFIIQSNSYCDYNIDKYKNYTLNKIEASRKINSDTSKRQKIYELIISK